ncbi:MAG: cadherin-like domain-containing protein [Desulfobacterales bacterium]|nr:cadherin-like domain-containing protein [Desulfobacterales bacterium]
MADNESFTVAEGGTATEANLDAGASLLDGDTDVDLPNDTLTVNTTPVINVSHGTLTLNANGTFTYVHDGSENFSDNFTYELLDADGGVSDTGTVTITITPVNDNEQVLAVNTGTTVAEGSTGNPITATMLQTTDVDNTADQLIYTVTTAPANGTLYLSGVALSAMDTFTQEDIDSGRITYDHDDSENLNDSFDFSVDDGAGAASTDTFTIGITAVNDNDPVAVDDTIVVGQGLTATALSGGATSVLLNDTDTDLPNDTLSVIVGTGPSYGSLTLNADGTFSYTHDGSNNLSDSFTYIVSDADGGVTDTGTVSITVNPTSTPPTATNLSTAESYTEDVPLDLTDIVVTDVDSSDVTVTLTLSEPAAGRLSTGTSGAVTSTYTGGVWTASGAIVDVNTLLAGVVFTPTTNYSGNFTIATSVDDGQAIPLSGLKIVTGTAVGDTPQAGSATTPMNTTTDLIVIDRHPDDGAEVTHFRITGVTNGTLYLADGITPITDGDFITVAQGQAGVRFTPAANSIATGGFTVEASEDGVSVALQSGTTTAVVTVIPIDSAASGDTPTEGETQADPETDLVPEPSESTEEDEEMPEEDIPVDIAAPVDPAPPENGAASFYSVADGRMPFIADAVRYVYQVVATDTDANKMAERVINQTKQSLKAATDNGLQLAKQQARLFNLMTAKTYMNLTNAFEELKDEVTADNRFANAYLGPAIVSTVGLSVGYVVWLVRGGMLLTSLLSSIPAWQILDPLPILARKRGEDGSDDDETLESILDEKPPKEKDRETSSDGASDAMKRKKSP